MCPLTFSIQDSRADVIPPVPVRQLLESESQAVFIVVFHHGSLDSASYVQEPVTGQLAPRNVFACVCKMLNTSNNQG